MIAQAPGGCCPPPGGNQRLALSYDVPRHNPGGKFEIDGLVDQAILKRQIDALDPGFFEQLQVIDIDARQFRTLLKDPSCPLYLAVHCMSDCFNSWMVCPG